MIARLSKILVALALASSIGLHWAFLQAVAWTGMIVSYSQAAPLREAVEKTFDGQHPCSLCKQIAQGKKSETKTEFKFEVKKLEYPYVPFAYVFQAPASFWRVPPRDDFGAVLTHAPPVPPPKDFLS